MARRNRTAKSAPRMPAAVEDAIPMAVAGAAAMQRSVSRRRNSAESGRRMPASPPWYAMASMAGPSWREAAFASGLVGGVPRDNWGNYFERCLRYDVFWSHYEGNVYRKIHLWASALKYDYRLYQHIRSIFSPAYRIGEFWARHLMGGPLDPAAGDGTIRPSALPIVTDDPDLRACIARAWRASNWQSQKDLMPRYGAVMGDVGLMVVDDPARRRVSFRVVSPRSVVEVARDPSGNVRGYTLSELRLDPTAPDPMTRTFVQYAEVCRRVGDSVEYTTYWNGEPFDWRDYPPGTPDSEMIGPTWTEPYGFVPFVFIQNRDMGLGFGWSELQPDLAKLYEQDDLASKVSDQVRKAVDAKWFASGAAPGSIGPADTDESDRDEDYLIYGPSGSDMKPLVAPLNLAEAIGWVKSISAEIERDHPELATEDVSPDASGEARRAAREMVEGLVVNHRAPYDDAMVRAQMMAVSIGAMRGYPGYEKFDAGSYDRGDLDHAIGDRPVFTTGESDRIAQSSARSTVFANLSGHGVPMAAALELAGWSPEVVMRVEALRIAELDAADARDAINQNRLFDQPEDGTDLGVQSNAAEGGFEGSEGLIV